MRCRQLLEVCESGRHRRFVEHRSNFSYTYSLSYSYSNVCRFSSRRRIKIKIKICGISLGETEPDPDAKRRLFKSKSPTSRQAIAIDTSPLRMRRKKKSLFRDSFFLELSPQTHVRGDQQPCRITKSVVGDAAMAALPNLPRLPIHFLQPSSAQHSLRTCPATRSFRLACAEQIAEPDSRATRMATCTIEPCHRCP